jgi:Asp-tRNA(Asn)/Glu-tRNA(Gln) amidotransferase A subunit family amidase
MKNLMDRRRFMTWITTSGLTALMVPAAFSADEETIAADAISKAESLSGLTFTPEERELMQKSVKEHLDSYRKLREIPIPNDLPPALTFNPLLPGRAVDPTVRPLVPSRVDSTGIQIDAPEFAFQPVIVLADLVRRRRITSVQLTELYLERLERFDPVLKCVITLTRDRAMAKAREADSEIGRGLYRGPLHGIPWGLKDLFAARGARTTWGAMPYKDQVIDEDATVVKRLDTAGAVLVAKLSVGALAWGDVWFDATTLNPWNLEEGSSGSSAGPAAATVAGLVGFSIGTETLGSIISPSQRCGATGLRPTFGRVSRHGGMALAWTMDKVGPICRSVEDCALVLDAIRGSDDLDGSVIDAPFNWDATRDPRRLRVGYDAEAFEKERDDKAFDDSALEMLRGMGFDLQPIQLPDLPVGDMLIILEAEAAAAFDDLTRSNRDDLLVRQIEQAWPNVFRSARLIPAVEYIQANRLRTRLMEEFEKTMSEVDVYVHPTYGGKTLLAANLTGHPSVVLPNGFRENGTPASISFTGRLFGEADLLQVAKAYQDETGFHEKHPDFM